MIPSRSILVLPHIVYLNAGGNWLVDHIIGCWLRTYSNTDSSPTSSTACSDRSKRRWVGGGGCSSLRLSIRTPTLRLLLHVGPGHAHICQMDPGNSRTLGKASHAPIYIALAWQTNTFLPLVLSLTFSFPNMSQAHPNSLLMDCNWRHSCFCQAFGVILCFLPRITKHKSLVMYDALQWTHNMMDSGLSPDYKSHSWLCFQGFVWMWRLQYWGQHESV